MLIAHTLYFLDKNDYYGRLCLYSNRNMYLYIEFNSWLILKSINLKQLLAKLKNNDGYFNQLSL
ncbi:hypothetical protein HPDP_00833 [Candidatus Hepatincola sp. Pdp]